MKSVAGESRVDGETRGPCTVDRIAMLEERARFVEQSRALASNFSPVNGPNKTRSRLIVRRVNTRVGLPARKKENPGGNRSRSPPDFSFEKLPLVCDRLN